MQSTPGGSSTSSGLSRGGGGGGGLARYRSAPAAWLEALLEVEVEDQEEDPLESLRPNESLTQLLSSSNPNPTTPPPPPPRNPNAFLSVDPNPFDSGSGTFLRQNSSPAEFLSSGPYDGLFSSFNVPGNYDYLSSSPPPQPGNKRPRETDLQSPSAKFATQVKREPSSSGQLHGGMSSLLDPEMEKLLEDSVPCRVRAKRGCATHPRSIAERVRRTRISDRIRKLQELVPNMDKQTNTADMLEEAVGYVKFLQNQIQELTEHQRKCKCLVRE